MQFRFLIKSLWHYRKAYSGILAGTVVGATVLLGALFAGDSVSGALKRLALLRVGKAEYAVLSGDRFVTEELSKNLANNLKINVAPLLYLRGSAARSELQLLAPQTQVIGVSEDFWGFAPSSEYLRLEMDRGKVAVNERLAQRLRLKEGDSFVFRIEKPGLLSRDAPLSGSKDNVVGVRAQVSAIVSDDQFGRFGLEANQVAPFSIFAPLSWIQDQIEQSDRVNLLLIKEDPQNDRPLSAETIQSEIAQSMKLVDFGLSLLDIPLANSTEIRTERVFLDEAIVGTVLERWPSAQPIITYLANTLKSNSKETPYSMVTAVDSGAAPFLGTDLAKGETVVNQWLADDLGVEKGDVLDISYFVIDQTNQLVEETSTFTIRSVAPMSGLVADRRWMPDFPGVAEADDSSDWDAGMPLDLSRIREKDEEYWDDFKGAPKAFLAFEQGSRMWQNRWGSVTGLRLPMAVIGPVELENELKALLKPAMVGLRVSSIRDSALQSANSPVDIGGLFLGMSFFLIVASLSLVAMLFSFSMQQLNRENALLSSLGTPDKRIYKWRYWQSIFIVIVGSVIAVPLASGYTVGILRFLETIWSSSSSGTLFEFRANPITAITGIGSNTLLALFAIWLVLRKQMKAEASFRLNQGSVESGATNLKKPRWSMGLGIAGILGGVVLLGVTLAGSLPLQIGYFLVGFSLLVGGIGVCSEWLSKGQWRGDNVLNPSLMGRLNNGRRPMRSLTVVGTLSCGVFLVVSVAAFRKERDNSGNDPKNGYGGYSFWVETAIPLNDAKDISGKDNLFGVEGASSVLPIRVGEGDDASCFNLNYTQNPRLLALNSSDLAERGAFTFHSIKKGLDSSEGWNLISSSEENGVLPAIVDAATLQWALKKKLGDRLEYIDSQGNTFEVELVGAVNDTIFQGNIIIEESLFLGKYPQNEGYRLFLIDEWSEELEATRAEIEFTLSPWGGKVESTVERLQSFHEVENTYIAIFHVLGGLGVILGSAGLGVVVARNLSERGHEFALLEAIGIPKKVRERIVFYELRSLIGWGVAIGLCAAVVSIVPSFKELGFWRPLSNIAILILAIIANAGFWAYLGYRRNAPSIMDLQRDFNS